MMRLPLLLALLLTAACYQDPQAEMDKAQQLTDLGDALTELNQRTSDLQFTLDSLRMIIAKQDTAIVRLSAQAGIPYQR